MRIFLITYLVFILFAAPKGMAQDILAPEAPPPDTKAIFESLSPELQNEILDESLAVQQVCQSNSMYERLYDCQCIALKFIDGRLLEGPGGSPVQLAQRYAPECKDAGKAAGYGLRACANISSTMAYGRQEYCDCFANHFARTYVSIPSTSTFAMRSSLSRAMSHCNRELGIR